MVRWLWLSLLLGVGLLLGSAPSHAQTLRIPKVGDPALSVNMPAGWSSNYDQYGNLQFSSSDRSVNLQLSILTGSLAGAPILDTLNATAASIFKASGAQPYSKSEPGALAGQLGVTYYSTLTTDNVTLNMKVVLAELDSSHVACMTIITRQEAALAQLLALNKLIGVVQLAK